MAGASRMFLILAAFASLLLGTVTTADAAKAPSYMDVFKYNWKGWDVYECPDGWNRRGVTCYKLYTEKLSWSDAKVVCNNYKGQLAMVEEQNTNIYIGDEVCSDSVSYWIGFTREGATGNVGYWSDGTKTDTVIGHWMNDQPDDNSGKCVKVTNDTEQSYPWSLHWCDDKLPFVCQRQACMNGEFPCSNGKCIQYTRRHDGKDDCGDMSDEVDKSGKCFRHIKQTSADFNRQSYDPKTDCMWILEGPVGRRLQLTFTQVDTEENIDVVDIYMGGSTLAASVYVTSLSGHITDHLPTFISSTNFMIVRFTSDRSVEKGGFAATFKTGHTCTMNKLPSYGRADDSHASFLWPKVSNEFICRDKCLAQTDCDAFTYVTKEKKCIAHKKIVSPKKGDCCTFWAKTCQGQKGEKTLPTIPGAGGSVSASTELSYLTSPFYPLKYFSNSKLVWIISAPKFSIITIERLDIDLGAGDSVTIYNGDKPTDPVLAKYTGDGFEGPRHVMTTGAAAYIYMDTKSLEAGRGFEFSYIIGCDVTLKGTDGIIQSPGYTVSNSQYPDIVKCTWIINVNTPLLLTFKDKFGLHNQDSLKIYEVLDKANVYSGNTKPNDIKAASGKLFIEFKTNAARKDIGFSAEFSIDCDKPPFNSSSLGLKITDISGSPITGAVNTHFGASFRLQCEPGYYFSQEEFSQENSLSQPVTMTCKRGGKWNVSNYPKCQPVYCGAVPGVANGFVVNTTSVLRGGTVLYKCFEGFIKGDHESLCLDNGSWSSQPTCTVEMCPKLGDISNGNVNATNTNKYGSVVTFNCDEGYQTDVGVPNTYCQANKTWRNADNLTTSCIKKRCFISLNIAHATTTPKRELVDFGQSVTVKCDIGYSVNGSVDKSQIIKCNANEKLDPPVPCKDIDECVNLTTCDHHCKNTEGGYLCFCNHGYKLTGDKRTCEDINDCLFENGGCSHTCDNSDGAYSCSCPPGHTLYLGNNFNGFGKRMTTSDINRTCVRETCPMPPAFVTHGTVLTEKKNFFYYEDKVKILCELGYIIADGSSSMNNAKMITCQSDKKWDSTFFNCTAATCERLSDEQLSKVKNPPTVIYPAGKDPIIYGTEVKLNCSVAGGEDSERTQTCLYDVAFGKYQLIGDSLECGVIDCGPPGELAGLKPDNLPDQTTYDASFTFECLLGFKLEGNNSDGGKKVRCQENGRWDLGGLRCLGPVCSDPGRPADGKQVAKSYEVGKTVTFECDRPGFEPEPSSIVCIFNGGTAKWNDTTSPTCVDKEKPMFTGCPKDIYVGAYETVSEVSPNITDNSGGVKSFSVDHNLRQPVTHNANLTWTAADHAGNVATPCVVTIHVKDEHLPTIKCPKSEEKYVDVEDAHDQKKVAVGKATAAGSKRIMKNILTPNTYTLSFSKDKPYKVINLKQESIDDEDVSAVCLFQYVIKPQKCRPWALRQPANVVSVKDWCHQQVPSGFSCKLTCKTGYTFYSQSPTLVYNCTEGEEFMNDLLGTYVPDCIKHEDASYKQEFVLRYSGNVVNTTTKPTYKKTVEDQLSKVKTALQNQCSNNMGSKAPDVEMTPTVKFKAITDKVYVTFTVGYTKNDPSDDVKTCADIVKARFVHIDGSLLGLENVKSIAPTGLPEITASYENTLSNGYMCPEGELLQDKVCVPCPSGYYKKNMICELCPEGTYNDKSSQAECQPCPNGTYTYSEGSVSVHQCYAECPPGLVSHTRLPPCTACPPLTYWQNATTCDTCPDDKKFTRGPQGGADISSCKAKCSPGSFSYDGHEPCRPCPRGFYQTNSGKTDCTACSAWEKTTAAEGSNSNNDCSVEVCASEVCKNGGTCSVDGYHQPKCSCAAGYTGDECETDIDECVSSPCYYNATCIDRVNGYNCTCREGTWHNMTETADMTVGSAAFTSKPLENKDACQWMCLTDTNCMGAAYTSVGICFIFHSDVTGTTEAGTIMFKKEANPSKAYTGHRCEIEVDNCAGSVTKCGHEGMCKDNDLDYECLCPTTDIYTDKWCHKETILCANNECQNGGNCHVVSDLRYICRCAAGYTGHNCETDIDECAENPCLYGGTCTDKTNDFMCNCPDGFNGKRCETRPASGSLCKKVSCDHGMCVEDYSTSKALCVCEPGYTSGQYKTLWLDVSDPDETGDDETLTTLKKKAKVVCGGSPPVGAKCRVKGSHTTFNESDSSSQDQQVTCSTAGLLCLNANQTANTTCDDYQIQFECDAGGSQCVNIDMCAEEKCQNGATCSDNSAKEGVYNCDCVPGFTGYNCQHNIDECASSPCQNGATCNDMINGYNCTCIPGYTGEHCETDVDDCQSSTCFVTGTHQCKDKVNNHQCVCKEGYTGVLCEKDYDECFSQPCLHHGVCKNELNKFSCDCPTGWIGHRCETIFSYCNPSPCKNGATCHDVFNSYFCQCVIGYDGRHCEKGPNVCEVANPCQNGGTCVVKLGMVKCTCPKHYTGDGCQYRIDYCSEKNNICKNGGSCSLSSTGDFSCSCPPGFTGDECETDIDDCASKDCSAGTCVDGVNMAYCLCPVGKVGSTCEKDIERSMTLEFGGSGGAHSLHTFQVNMNSSSLGVWVRYADKDGTGTFLSMHMVKSQTSTEVKRTLMSMNEMGVTINFSDGDKFSLKYPRDVNNGHWHYVALSLEDGKVTLHIDALSDSPRNFEAIEPVYAILQVGGSGSDTFRGKLSLVQVWNVARNSSEVIGVHNAMGVHITSPSYTEGLVADWGWDSFQPGPGLKKVVSSQICLGEHIMVKDTCVNKTEDIVPPTVTCPKQSVGKVAHGRLTNVIFPNSDKDEQNISKTFQSGDQFPVGVTPVVYNTTDAAGNQAMCVFNVFLRLGTCKDPPHPIDGIVQCRDVDKLHRRCTVSCGTYKTFLRPVPKLFTCGPVGVWNTNHPKNQFKFPPCGYIGIVKKRLKFGWDFKLVGDFSTDNAKALEGKLRLKFVNWNKNLTALQRGTSFCVKDDCSDLSITVTDYNTAFRLKMEIVEVAEKVGKDWPVAAAVTEEVLLNHGFDLHLDLPGAKDIDRMSYWIEEDVSCDADYQVVGNTCVKCTAGTVYKSPTKTCDDCPIGTYRGKTDTKCKACPPGKTTEAVGSTSSSECIDLCPAGHFFKASSHSCEPCGFGYYQPDAGRTYCLACATDYITPVATAVAKGECIKACAAGHDLVNGTCEKCAQGFYKGDETVADKFGYCKICPVNFTTEREGATNIGNCSRANCSAGYETVNDKCVPCPMGTYQPDKWKDKCIDCPHGNITSELGATSEDACNVRVVWYTFSLTLDLAWSKNYETKNSSLFLKLEREIKKSIEYLFSETLSDIYIKGLVKLQAATKGSVVVLLTAPFDSMKGNKKKNRLEDVLITTVNSGHLPVPPGEHFDPLNTVISAKPQVSWPVFTDCPRGKEVETSGCRPCPKDTYQPTVVRNICYRCDAGYGTVGSRRVGDKNIVCKDLCTANPSYCRNGGSCKFDTYGKKPICTCSNHYIGNHCETRTDVYADSSIPLIIGLVIGGTALLLFLMFIVAFFNYRKRMQERKEKRKEERARAKMSNPTMTRAMPAASTFGGYAPRTAMGTSAPWAQPGHHMFYNDDFDEPSAKSTNPFHSNAVFQRS